MSPNKCTTCTNITQAARPHHQPVYAHVSDVEVAPFRRGVTLIRAQVDVDDLVDLVLAVGENVLRSQSTGELGVFCELDDLVASRHGRGGVRVSVGSKG